MFQIYQCGSYYIGAVILGHQIWSAGHLCCSMKSAGSAISFQRVVRWKHVMPSAIKCRKQNAGNSYCLCNGSMLHAQPQVALCSLQSAEVKCHASQHQKHKMQFCQWLLCSDKDVRWVGRGIRRKTGYWDLAGTIHFFRAKAQVSLKGGQVTVHGCTPGTTTPRVLCGCTAVGYSLRSSF